MRGVRMRLAGWSTSEPEEPVAWGDAEQITWELRSSFLNIHGRDCLLALFSNQRDKNSSSGEHSRNILIETCKSTAMEIEMKALFSDEQQRDPSENRIQRCMIVAQNHSFRFNETCHCTVDYTATTSILRFSSDCIFRSQREYLSCLIENFKTSRQGGVFLSAYLPALNWKIGLLFSIH